MMLEGKQELMKFGCSDYQMTAPKWITIEIMSFYINVLFIIVNILFFKCLPYFSDNVIDSSEVIK